MIYEVECKLHACVNRCDLGIEHGVGRAIAGIVKVIFWLLNPARFNGLVAIVLKCAWSWYLKRVFFISSQPPYLRRFVLFVYCTILPTLDNSLDGERRGTEVGKM